MWYHFFEHKRVIISIKILPYVVYYPKQKMEKVFGIAVLVTLLFSITKFLEMKYLEKEWKPLKSVVRDAVIVFICTFASGFVIFEMNGSINDFFNVVTETKTLNPAATQVFTDDPGF